MKLSKSMRDAFVRAAMADVPQIDYSEQISTIIREFAVKQLPPKIQAVWKDKELKGFIGLSKYYISDKYHYYPGDNLKLSSEVVEKITALNVLKNEQRNKLRSLRSQLEAACLAFTTAKALREALPEFAKYLPDDPVKADRSLPNVTNVVTDFVKAGWPSKKGGAK